MTDRELLEAAARAAGYPFDEGHFQAAERPGAWWGWVYIDGSGDPPEDSAWTELWNPLTDDGDALRLAVKLKFKVTIGWDNPTLVTVEWIERHEDGWAVKELEGGQENDPFAATRRAIVRAAAALGEKE